MLNVNVLCGVSHTTEKSSLPHEGQSGRAEASSGEILNLTFSVLCLRLDTSFLSIQSSGVSGSRKTWALDLRLPSRRFCVQVQNQDTVKAWGSFYTKATHKMLQSHWTTELHTNPSLQKENKSFVGKPYLSQYLRDPKLAPLEESPETPKCLLWPHRALILRLEKHVKGEKHKEFAVTWVFQIIWGRYLRGNLLINQTQTSDQIQPNNLPAKPGSRAVCTRPRPSFKVCNMGFPGSSDGKESTCKCRRHEFNPCIGKIPPGIPWRKCQPTPILLPEEFHGQRNLAGYSPCGHKKLDTTD